MKRKRPLALRQKELQKEAEVLDRFYNPACPHGIPLAELCADCADERLADDARDDAHADELDSIDFEEPF